MYYQSSNREAEMLQKAFQKHYCMGWKAFELRKLQYGVPDNHSKKATVLHIFAIHAHDFQPDIF